MLNYKEIFSLNSFGMNQKLKNDWFLKIQKQLSRYHYNNCKEFKRLLDNLFGGLKTKNLIEMPYMHSSLFKTFKIKTTKDEKYSKIFTSSGTSVWIPYPKIPT